VNVNDVHSALNPTWMAVSAVSLKPFAELAVIEIRLRALRFARVMSAG
jgi:hypothetical protein